MLQMFVLALSLYNTWNRGVFLLCKITNLLIYSNITLFNLTDEPYKMFSIKCTIYNYFVLVFNYDRGHFGCNIVCGDDAIALPNDREWDNDCDFAAFWKNVDEQIRLRIPDKYLQAYGWL